MKSQTSLVAMQVRLQHWADQIKACQLRPTGMTVEAWCEMQGISKANYYYRLRCVREACLEQVQNRTPETCDFIELTTLIKNNQKQQASLDTKPVALLRGPDNISIELFSSATPDFLKALVGAFAYVK